MPPSFRVGFIFPTKLSKPSPALFFKGPWSCHRQNGFQDNSVLSIYESLLKRLSAGAEDVCVQKARLGACVAEGCGNALTSTNPALVRSWDGGLWVSSTRVCSAVSEFSTTNMYFFYNRKYNDENSFVNKWTLSGIWVFSAKGLLICFTFFLNIFLF